MLNFLHLGELFLFLSRELICMVIINYYWIFFTQFRRSSGFVAIGINCFTGIIFPRLHRKNSKLSLKVLFFKAFLQSDGLMVFSLNESLSSLSKSFIYSSIQLSHSKWLVSPSQLTILPKIYLSIISNIFGEFTWRRKKTLRQLWFYGPFLAFLKLRKFPSTSLNLIFSCYNII